jgi:hypothetical protein
MLFEDLQAYTKSYAPWAVPASVFLVVIFLFVFFFPFQEHGVHKSASKGRSGTGHSLHTEKMEDGD